MWYLILTLTLTTNGPAGPGSATVESTRTFTSQQECVKVGTDYMNDPRLVMEAKRTATCVQGK